MQAPHLEDIALDRLYPSPFNPRKGEVDITDLKASIGRSGVTNPIIVRRTPQPADGDKKPVRYEVLAGSRRWAAAHALGLCFVPCLIYFEMSDDEARDLAITDNLQRADIHPMEEAEAYRTLMAAHAATAKLAPALPPAAIAARVGKTESYVATRLRLLDLILWSKALFEAGHITLGHALILARLTPKDQERALDFLLQRDPRQTKEPQGTMVERRLRELARDKGVDYRGRPNATRGRLIEATEAQLKKWVETSVLLILKGVPWDLADEALVPAAGACVTCPKRTGASPALFTEFTAQEDVCTDGACFGAKQDAVVRKHREAAKDQGLKLLKLSAKESTLKLDEPAVQGALVVTAKAVKAGQWVKVGAKICENTVTGVMTDGPDKGKLVKACADQACKIHKHEVRRPGGGHTIQETRDPAKEAAELAKREAWVKRETPIRIAVFNAIRTKASDRVDVLQALVLEAIEDWPAVTHATLLGVPFNTKGENWTVRNNAGKALRDEASKATGERLREMAFALLFGSAAEIDADNYKNPKQDRGELWKMAAKYKVDADAIASKVSVAQEPVVKPGKPAVKPLKKQAAKAKAGGKKR